MPLQGVYFHSIWSFVEMRLLPECHQSGHRSRDGLKEKGMMGTWMSVGDIPAPCMFRSYVVAERETNMHTLQRSEHYTDKGSHAVMTRMAIVTHAQLRRIADQLRSNAEDLAFSTHPPTLENCRIAGAMVGWAFTLVPLCIEAKFDY